MTQLELPQKLILRTCDGLPLQLSFDSRKCALHRWTATLNLRPSRAYTRAGIKTGHEVARAWTEDPPHQLGLDDASDTRDNISVFVGPCMFSVPRSEAAKLQPWVVSMLEQVPA